MRIDRRDFLSLGVGAGVGVGTGLGWLTPAAYALARRAEVVDGPRTSVIMLWLAGGPSQLETFDPHPDSSIAGGTRAIETAAKGVRLAEGFERLADEMGSIALVRSVTSKEGDHERGTYMLKTGYRPDPSVVHPSIGAICCHQLPVGPVDIPRHVSILAGQWPGRGGFLGGEYDAFQVDDPGGKLPDVSPFVPADRDARRALDLEVVDRAFARGRARRVEATLHRRAVDSARAMMTSEQLRAFDVSQESAETRAEYGDTPFGRGCLAARRLIEEGVRCVEVTLDGWDSHVNNHEIHRRLAGVLDPAFAALVRDLRRRDLLGRTVVVCCGEFGRTPRINPFAGRDHWTNGFSLALAGCGLNQGVALGETDPEGTRDPARPVPVQDVHATILSAIGLDPASENFAPVTGRPVKLSEGRRIPELIG